MLMVNTLSAQQNYASPEANTYRTSFKKKSIARVLSQCQNNCLEVISMNTCIDDIIREFVKNHKIINKNTFRIINQLEGLCPKIEHSDYYDTIKSEYSAMRETNTHTTDAILKLFSDIFRLETCLLQTNIVLILIISHISSLTLTHL